MPLILESKLKVTVRQHHLTFTEDPRGRAEFGTDTETGPGVFETALGYTDAGRMADNASLFKLVAKSVGMKHGITPTFMAKPYSDVGLPPDCLGVYRWG